jgi:hypothetical protein
LLIAVPLEQLRGAEYGSTKPIFQCLAIWILQLPSPKKRFSALGSGNFTAPTRIDTAKQFAPREMYSSFSLTEYLPLYSSRCLPTFSM